MSQAQIIVSLLAKHTDLLILIASTVGCKPAKPTIADIVISILPEIIFFIGVWFVKTLILLFFKDFLIFS